LNVEKDADDKALKRGYKVASLKWHPDKNQHEDTTEKF
jgi:DnaJ-class molecular chaperone